MNKQYANTRGPQWALIGRQAREDRNKRFLTQREVGVIVAPDHPVGAHQGLISRDENGLQVIPPHRLKAYADLYEWDLQAVLKIAAGEGLPDPVTARAQSEYHELMTLLDGKLRNGDEQDVIDLAVQQVIQNRYPHLSPLDFTL